jgi:hypothetical protein
MFDRKPQQKLISFLDSSTDLDEVKQDMKNGWTIISLVQSGNHYMGLMEKTDYNSQPDSPERTIYLPPIKKVKISMLNAR